MAMATCVLVGEDESKMTAVQQSPVGPRSRSTMKRSYSVLLSWVLGLSLHRG